MSKLDDEIIKLRIILGLIYGLIAYVIYRFRIVLFIDVSATIWFLAGVIYVLSGFYIQYKFKVTGIFHTFIRGIITYYSIWIILFLALYDLFG